GESLVNDASALLVYRLAIGTAVAGNLTVAGIVPTTIAVIVGSIAVGILLSLVLIRLIAAIRDVPIAIIVQFVGTFGVWILADRVGLSSVLTIVAFAIAGARSSTRLSTPPQVRIPTNAVWAAVTFVLNALALVLTAIVARFCWVMAYSTAFRLIGLTETGEDGKRTRPSYAGALVISWAGMRGI